MRAQALVARNIRRLRVGRGLSQETPAVYAGIDRTGGQATAWIIGAFCGKLGVARQAVYPGALWMPAGASPSPAPQRAGAADVRVSICCESS